tara:strand:+ start:25 stop:150 length:126 start_codon:yes stop_codon:yes gene_type:complete
MSQIDKIEDLISQIDNALSELDTKDRLYMEGYLAMWFRKGD